MPLYDIAWEAFGKQERENWIAWLRRLFKGRIALRPKVFGCPDCAMPIDERMQKTNVRIEPIMTTIHSIAVPHYILSCPWCYRVMNIGSVEEIDKKIVMAKKE